MYVDIEKAMKMKRCSKCGIEKDESEFHKGSHKDGLNAHCKQCRKVHYYINKEKIREYQTENKENIREYQKKYDKKRYEENKEMFHERGIKYRNEHKDEISKCKRGYYEKNKEQELERTKNWRKENNEHYLECKNKWRRTTLKGKEQRIRDNSKRRKLGHKPINIYFKGSEAHHLRYSNNHEEQDNDMTIYVPRELHRSTPHNGNTGKGMREINILLLEWYLSNTPVESRNKKAVDLYLKYCMLPEPVWIS